VDVKRLLHDLYITHDILYCTIEPCGANLRCSSEILKSSEKRMGINGLLPVLKSIAKPKHIREYHGQHVAIDGFSWLHKGAYCCSRDLCTGVFTDKLVLIL
jgi:hypothetical protein